MQPAVVHNPDSPGFGYALPFVAVAFTGGMFAHALSIPKEERTDKWIAARILWGAAVLSTVLMLGITVGSHH